jgi:thiamine-phosphate pyrophosphorylase
MVRKPGVNSEGEFTRAMKKIGFRLYLITDRSLFSDRLAFYAALDGALQGGVKALQLREKDLEIRQLLEMAYTLRELTNRYGAKLFINDRVDVALSAGADGVHLGGSGIPVRGVRRIAGEDLLIGASAHNVQEATEAEDEGADFITLGPVYETPSKARYGRPLGPDILKKTKDELSIPVFAIGGIKLGKVREVLKSGAYGVALISAVLASHDIKTQTEEFVRLLK